jgi:quercetin dioxygenase-like cupin family protein
MPYSAKDIIDGIGIPRNKLNLLRRQGYVHPICIRKGGRQVFSYSEHDFQRIKRMVAVMNKGVSPRWAAEQVAEEMGSPSPPGDSAQEEGSAFERRLQPAANGREFGRLAEAIAARQGMNQEQVLNIYRSWVAALPDSVQSQFGIDTKLPIACLADALGDRQYPLRFVRSLGFNLGVHTLLLDPLFARVVPESTICLKLDRVRDFLPIGDNRDSDYGRGGTQYRIPWCRLPRTGGVLGTLTLDPKAASDAHLHPGEEWCVSLSGAAELRLGRSGIVNLNAGDYCHFDADQMHSAANTGDRPAHIFILRLYADANSTKDRVRDRWGGLDKEGDKLPPWLNPLAHKPALEGGSEAVEDLFGFGEFLRHIGLTRGWDQVVERWRSAHPGRTIEQCNEDLKRLEEGHENVTAADLPDIAMAYSTPEVLLHSFLAPSLPGAVTVRGLFNDPLPDHEFRSVDLGGGTAYWLPRRNLRYSDLSTAVVRLEPGAGTPHNDHPGLELAIPIRGRVVARFPEDGQAFSASTPRELLIYSSERTHCVCNETDAPAEAVLIRFRSSKQTALKP